MRCKLDSTENPRSFEKYPTPPERANLTTCQILSGTHKRSGSGGLKQKDRASQRQKWIQVKHFQLINGRYCGKKWRRIFWIRRWYLHFSNPLFGDLEYVLYIESIGSQEHTLLKVGQRWIQVVSEKGDFTGKMAILRGFFRHVPQKESKLFLMMWLQHFWEAHPLEFMPFLSSKFFFDTLSCFPGVGWRILKCLFVCLFVGLFVCWIKTRQNILRLLCWEGSKPPGSDHTRAEAQTTCIPKTAVQTTYVSIYG